MSADPLLILLVWQQWLTYEQQYCRQSPLLENYSQDYKKQTVARVYDQNPVLRNKMSNIYEYKIMRWSRETYIQGVYSQDRESPGDHQICLSPYTLADLIHPELCESSVPAPANRIISTEAVDRRVQWLLRPFALEGVQRMFQKVRLEVSCQNCSVGVSAVVSGHAPRFDQTLACTHFCFSNLYRKLALDGRITHASLFGFRPW